MVHDGHGAGVEKDEEDDEPEPPLLLAHLAYGDAEGGHLGPELAGGTCKASSGEGVRTEAFYYTIDQQLL